jgi:hypothetical protein
LRSVRALMNSQVDAGGKMRRVWARVVAATSARRSPVLHSGPSGWARGVKVLLAGAALVIAAAAGAALVGIVALHHI